MMLYRRMDRPLNQRDLEVLRDVVETYLLTATPVSSRALARSPQYDLSAASIRNVMADLDDLGYLRQKHTSAGRVPTARGYHLFIDELMRVKEVTEQERAQIDHELSASGDSLPAAASHVLSQLSQQVVMVLVAARDTTRMRSIEFVPLSEGRVLCVTVSDAGFIDHKVFDADEALTREELIRISNYLNETFAGCTLVEVRDRLLRLMEDARAQMDVLLRNAIRLADRGLARDTQAAVVVEGTESLLLQPELADLAQVRKLFETFTDKARLVAMLNRCMEGEGVRVFIGEESDLTSGLDCSLVAKSYGAGGRVLGTIGVFGPSRMEYPRLIPLVDYLGKRLSETLAATM